MFKIVLLVAAILPFCHSLQKENAAATKFEPAIAMNCDKNTKHRDLQTGEWVTDEGGRADCMKSSTEILSYCQNLYPDLDIVNIVELKKEKISNWCSLGNTKSCRGHPRNVTPFQCIVGEFNSPALRVESECEFRHESNNSICKRPKEWAIVAKMQCENENMVRQERFGMLLPCNETPDMFHGIEFVCCPTIKTPKAKSNVIVVNPHPGELEPTSLKSICSLPKKVGLCRASFDVWYFDTKSGQCLRFIYGGCGGNDNNFKTLEECQATCSPQDPVDTIPLFQGLGPVIFDETPEQTDTKTEAINKDCDLPKMVGMCKAMFRRWFYNSKTDQCVAFVYGGCGGNKNNFKSFDECQNSCQKVQPTTLATTTTEKEEPISASSYLGAPSDIAQEHQIYINSVQQELSEHQAKMTKVMTDWDEANTNLLKQALSNPKGVAAQRKQIQADFARTRQSLLQEHKAKQNQLSMLHSARMNSIFDKSRQSSFTLFMQQLNAITPQANATLITFKNYIKQEKLDYDHAVDHLENDVEDSLPDIKRRIENIKDRVINAYDLLQQNSELFSEIEDEIDDFLDSLPSSFFSFDSDFEEGTDLPIIDNGGLPAENGNDDYFGDEDEEDDDDDEDDYYNEDDDENDEFDSDEDEDDVPETYAVATTTTTPEVDNDGDFDVDEDLTENDWRGPYQDDDNDDNVEDDIIPDELDINRPNINSAAVFGNNYEDSSEVAWLKWGGAAFAGLALLVCLVAIVRYSVVRHRMTHQFTKIRVDDHLTPEERQLWQMQQNGYENPTYKFFEKQQMA